MKPTFLKVGVPKNTVRPPTSIRPPTASGNPASSLSNVVCYDDGTLTSDTHSWLIPSGRVAGDIIFAFIMTYNSSPGAAAISSVPSGYTLLDTQHDTGGNDNYCYVYFKVSDGTETSSTFSTTSPARVAAVFGRIPSNGATLPTPDINSVANPIVDTATINPPAITPAAGAGTYHIISVLMGAKGGPDPDADSAVSTGYTNVIDCDAGGGVITSRVVVQQKASTAVVTTEDPDNYDWTASTGSRWFGCFTIAVSASSADPDVAPFSHTHVEADVTDLAHTDADAIHDNVAGEISAITAKGTPTSSDFLLIEDAADSNNKKSITIGDLPTGASDHGTLTGLTDDDHTQYLLAAGTRAATYLEVSGLTGATGSSPRFVGGTTTGAPVSGTFALGDYVVTEDGNIYVCTTAGSPGSWTAVGAGAATDANAIHDNVASEISALTLVTAAAGDHVLIEDASDSNAKKRVAASDFLSGGGGWAGTIVPPASPGADDDEFDGANGVGTPPGWTLLATSGNQTITEANDVLSVAFDSQLGNDFNGIAKSATISTGDKVTTALKTLLRGNFDLVGVGFTDGTASTSNAIGVVTYVASTRLEVWTGTLQAMTGVAINTVNRDSFISPLFLQLEYVSANTFSSRVSPDGVSWITFDASRSYTFTPTHMALFWSTAGGGTVNIVSFDFIRLS